MATKEMVDNAKLAVARWWYDVNVPFNGAHSKYYQSMFDTTLPVGPGLKGSYFHDLRGNLLRTLVDEITTYPYDFRPIWEFKKDHRQMFTCDKWLNSKLAKSVVGKEVVKLVLEDRDFWLQCEHVVKLIEPLVGVLRLTDDNKKPSTVYLAIGRTKEALDHVSLDNINVLVDWVSEEESIITQEDLDNDGGWDVFQPEHATINLEDEEVNYEDEEDAIHDIPSQCD
ncbi:hypothetical protein RJ640_006276 [Escallonia rubra]|uniref:Uncharacterized protein n=1 Tax=Escallonia rubra TaxID=112253 RepID=A0AA88R7U4_9ASTE|nr:hypothetical protein RJ640_006276 [Escallonia rubra]